MVSFRYHVVSLTAVLLALAVGIVVGTTSVPAAPAARQVVVDGSGEDFARRVAPRLLKDALVGQRVLLLLAPDAPAPREVVDGLRTAGATVTAQVRLQPALLDPSGSATVDDVVAGVLPDGLTLPQTSAIERAGAELAASLVTSDQGTDAGDSGAQRVLGGFSGADLLAFDGAAPTRRATLVLVLAGPARGAALASLAASFQARVGTVVAAPLAAARGTGVIAVQRSGTGGASDVDGLGTPQALVGAVLALAEQAAGGAGHYGTGPRASGVVPDLS